jgi:hypothetical protein
VSNPFDAYVINPQDIRFENGVMEPDATQVAAFSGYIDSSIDKDVTLSKGWYRFTIKNPVSFNASLDVVNGVMPVDDGTGNVVNKRYTVQNLSYSVVENRMFVDVHVIDNPIPLFIVWGAVAVALAVAGALAVNSVLESIEQITAPVFNFLTSPVGIIAIIGVLALLILPYFRRKL